MNRDFDSDVRKLVNKSFRLEDRSSAVILKDSQGVVFVEGSGAAERVKIDSETVKILALPQNKEPIYCSLTNNLSDYILSM